MSRSNKSTGNDYENKTAKKLSNWIFDDDISIMRSITSGALKGSNKVRYNGDLIPIGDKVYKKFKIWPFLIECKTGYEQVKPTFQSYRILENWINKLNLEKTNEQKIILLICKFGKGRAKEILISNIKFLIKPYISFMIGDQYYHVYDFKLLTNYEISSLFPLKIKNQLFN